MDDKIKSLYNSFKSIFKSNWIFITIVITICILLFSSIWVRNYFTQPRGQGGSNNVNQRVEHLEERIRSAETRSDELGRDIEHIGEGINSLSTGVDKATESTTRVQESNNRIREELQSGKEQLTRVKERSQRIEDIINSVETRGKTTTTRE